MREHERDGSPQNWREARRGMDAVFGSVARLGELLRQHRMPRSEFHWLERRVYDEWYSRSGRDLGDDRLRQTTREDVAFVADLIRRHGRSPALTELGARLEQRLADLAPPPGSIPDPNHELLMRYRSEIADLDFSAYADLHHRLRQGGHSPGRVGR